MGAPRVIRVRLELVGSLEMPVGSGWWLLLVTWESVRVLQRAFVLALLGMKAIDCGL